LIQFYIINEGGDDTEEKQICVYAVEEYNDYRIVRKKGYENSDSR
jgi:hypothetical protein